MTDDSDMADVLHEALVDMVYQFAYRGMQDNKRIFMTGGLSALEGAFYVLGWDDPHFVGDEHGCEIAGCERWSGCVGAYPRSLAKPGLESPSMIGFGFLCSEHSSTWNGPRAVLPAPADLGRLK